jgi:hypothetical protein
LAWCIITIKEIILVPFIKYQSEEVVDHEDKKEEFQEFREQFP